MLEITKKSGKKFIFNVNNIEAVAHHNNKTFIIGVSGISEEFNISYQEILNSMIKIKTGEVSFMPISEV